MQYLQEHYDLSQIQVSTHTRMSSTGQGLTELRLQVRGASGGALTATLLVCNVDPSVALESAYRLALDAGVFQRGLAGIWGALIMVWLHELLPPDAADLARFDLVLGSTA